MDERGFVKERSKRAVATILGYKDDYCNKYLPVETSKELREVVMDSIGEFVDAIYDLLDSSSEPAMNQYYLDLIEKTFEHVSRSGEE